MWRDLRENWRNGGYWSWWWRELVSGDMKLVLALALAIAVAIAGFLSAEAMSSSSESSPAESQQAVTVKRTVVRKVQRVRIVTRHATRVVTDVRTVYLPGRATTVTHVVTVRVPQEPSKAVTHAVTVSRPVTVTVQAPPVTAVVTEPVTVTTPGETVTVTVDKKGKPKP